MFWVVFFFFLNHQVRTFFPGDEYEQEIQYSCLEEKYVFLNCPGMGLLSLLYSSEEMWKRILSFILEAAKPGRCCLLTIPLHLWEICFDDKDGYAIRSARQTVLNGLPLDLIRNIYRNCICMKYLEIICFT